jgi:hypothetical protein
MHLYYPHHGSQPRTFKTRMQSFFSPSRQNNSTKNRTWFSIFYTAANTFPLASAAIHWFVMVPTEHATMIPGTSASLAWRTLLTLSGDQTFGHGWYTTFFVLNKYAISAAIAFVEIFFLSSIKRQEVEIIALLRAFSQTNMYAAAKCTSLWTRIPLLPLHWMGLHRICRHWQVCVVVP